MEVPDLPVVEVPDLPVYKVLLVLLEYIQVQALLKVQQVQLAPSVKLVQPVWKVPEVIAVHLVRLLEQVPEVQLVRWGLGMQAEMICILHLEMSV